MENYPFRIANTVLLFWLTFGCAACKRNAIVILPAKDEDPEMKQKWKAIEKALKGHEELYFVKEFRQGVDITKSKPPVRLAEILWERNFETTEKTFEEKKITGHAFQIGVGLKAKSDVRYIGDPNIGYDDDADVGSKQTPTPKPKPGWPHLHLIKQIKESKELVKKVDEILSEPAPSPSTPTPTPEP